MQNKKSRNERWIDRVTPSTALPISAAITLILSGCNLKRSESSQNLSTPPITPFPIPELHNQFMTDDQVVEFVKQDIPQQYNIIKKYNKSQKVALYNRLMSFVNSDYPSYTLQAMHSAIFTLKVINADAGVIYHPSPKEAESALKIINMNNAQFEKFLHLKDHQKLFNSLGLSEIEAYMADLLIYMEMTDEPLTKQSAEDLKIAEKLFLELYQGHWQSKYREFVNPQSKGSIR